MEKDIFPLDIPIPVTFVCDCCCGVAEELPCENEFLLVEQLLLCLLKLSIELEFDKLVKPGSVFDPKDVELDVEVELGATTPTLPLPLPDSTDDDEPEAIREGLLS
ncbi:unnamed protein product [[Candida] boidinii]|nr:unnamed protein product [[Candida] boidinii]